MARFLLALAAHLPLLVAAVSIRRKAVSASRRDADQAPQSNSSSDMGDLQQVVWVSGYPRSGTSTILSMVSAAGVMRSDPRIPGQIFSLFEPCHNGDVLEEPLDAAGCRGLLLSLAQCDFTKVANLWGWRDPHSSNNRGPYSKEMAVRHCSSSDVVAFKTVDFGHNLAEHVDMFTAEPRMKVLDVVRDPRGIFASWKTTEPFRTLVSEDRFYTLAEVCDAFAANLELNHPSVYHVDFEQAMRHPHEMMRKVYDFLELPYGDAQEAWVNRTFDASDCPPAPKWLRGFTDCHTQSEAESEKWRNVLTAEELEIFNTTPSCQQVVRAYNYSL